jgi:hypothetical protein
VPPDFPFHELGFCALPTMIDGGGSGYEGGYCFADCSDFVDICGSNALCRRTSSGRSLCFSRCSPAGMGQGSCRAGYVCVPSDGGGYCDRSCLAAGAGCDGGLYCDAGYCMQ